MRIVDPGSAVPAIVIGFWFVTAGGFGLMTGDWIPVMIQYGTSVAGYLQRL